MAYVDVYSKLYSSNDDDIEIDHHHHHHDHDCNHNTCTRYALRYFKIAAEAMAHGPWLLKIGEAKAHFVAWRCPGKVCCRRNEGVDLTHITPLKAHLVWHCEKH